MKKFLLILSLLFSCNHNTEECFCTEEYNPVCAGYNQYSNPCKAQCDGFENSEITILLTQEEISSLLKPVIIAENPINANIPIAISLLVFIFV